MSEFPDDEKKKARRLYSPDPHRLLPQSPDAEKGLISSMLIGGPALVEELLALVTGDHFFVPAHRLLFSAMAAVHLDKRPIDFVTLTQDLRDADLLDQAGGAAFVTEMFTFLPTAANWLHYATIVREKYVLRRIIELCTSFAGRAYDEQDDPQGLLEEFQTEAVEIGSLAADAEALKLVDKEEIMGRLSVVEDRYHQRGEIAGLSTGFADLDRILDGLKPKKVYVVAGRPAMGKSALGGNIAEHICVECIEDKKYGGAAAFFSMEMPREDLVDRMLFKRAQINLQRIRDGFMSARDFDKLQKAAVDCIKGRMWIDDTPGLTIAQFRARARKAVIKHKCRVIVVDYVQIMKGSSKRSRDNKAAEISEIMQGLRETAKQLNVPIVALAQINRGAEDRPGSRPTMADMKDGGGIEEEASVVMMLYRPPYYAKTDDKREEIAKKYKVSLEDVDHVAELIIGKHRGGGVGTIQLRFFGETTEFRGVTEKTWSNNPDERQQPIGEEED